MAAIARKRRGIPHASIPRFEERILKFEDKIELNASDHTLIQCMVERLENMDADFKQHHMGLIETIEDEEKLAEEQLVLDDHDDKI